MAMYHFKIKSDKKPDGTTISGIDKVEYIDREGKYANIDNKDSNEVSPNLIIAKNPIERFPEKETLLYESPFGWIKYSKNGIRVSVDASPATIGIAMSIARYIYGENNPLSINGHRQFTATTSLAAAELNLPVKFSDNVLNTLYTKYNQKEKDADKNGRIPESPYFNTYGTGNGSFYGNRIGGINGNSKLSKSDIAGSSIGTITKAGFSLPTLSGSKLVYKRRRTAMLLPFNGKSSIYRTKRYPHVDVRRSLYGSSKRKEEITQAAVAVMTNIQHNMSNVFAESHLAYINRETTFKGKGGCLFKAHHLPSWANNSPKEFFAAADLIERTGGERYKEIEFALPNEMNLEQQKEFVNEFLQKHMSNFYYAYAIHDKVGAMSNGEKHPHVHLMFSTREIDSIEKQKERPPELFFHRANTKAPALGGCKKADIWIGNDRKHYLNYLREDFAKIQNAALKKYGIPARVDHRSLKARRQEALANGNAYLANLLDRYPQKYIGLPASPLTNRSDINKLKAFRNQLRIYEKSVFSKYFLQSLIDENTVVREFKMHQSAFQPLKNAQINDSEKNAIVKNIVQVEDEINLTLDLTLKSHETVAEAQLEFMTDSERELWQDFKKISAEKSYWHDFKSRLTKPQSNNDLDDYNKLCKEISHHIEVEGIKQKELLPSVQAIFIRLNNDPEKKKIEQRAAAIIFENKANYKKLKQLNKQYAVLIDSLKQTRSIINTANISTGKKSNIYSIQDVIKEQTAKISALRQQLRKQQQLVKEAAKKVISPARAMAMAKNLYTNGQYKRLREAKALLSKNKAGLSPEALIKEQTRLAAWKQRLDTYTSTPDAIIKIQEISDGILAKNSSALMIYNDENNKLMLLNAEISSINNVTAICSNEAKNYPDAMYKVMDTGTSISAESYDEQLSPPLHIASALSGNIAAAQLVAKSKHGDSDDWELLSEAEKEELRNNEESMTR